VFGVLEVVLTQHPVAGRVRITGQLLILLEDVLRVAAHLHAVGTVRIEGSIGVVRLRLAATAAPATTAPIAPALALHTLEISHILRNRLVLP
jgi:hypothetical protein